MTLLWAVRTSEIVTRADPHAEFGTRSAKEDVLVSFELDEPSLDVSRLAGLPKTMVEAYASAAARHAYFERLDSGEYIGAVSGLDGVWGEGASEEEARSDLRESIIDWVVVRRDRGLGVPRIEGIDLND